MNPILEYFPAVQRRYLNSWWIIGQKYVVQKRGAHQVGHLENKLSKKSCSYRDAFD